MATRDRTAPTASSDSSARSRITCQRIEGSESSSQRMTALFGFVVSRLTGATRWLLFAICRETVLAVLKMLRSMEKWTGWGLNPRPLPCQDSDLPADLPARGAL